MSTEKRPVRRCLVMIDYGEGDTANGEVFDLTALLWEMNAASPNSYGGNLSITIDSNRHYDRTRPDPHEYQVKFSGHISGGEWVHGATHLDDVVNAAMPDGDAVQILKAKAERLQKKVESLQSDAAVAKLRQVAAIRHQHPIARFDQPIPQIATAP